jgi:hypothetical protein
LIIILFFISDFNVVGSNSAADDLKEDICMSKSMRLWVGVDAEWRAVILPKGKEAKDKDNGKMGNHANVQHGAATLQVCTADLYLSLSFSFLSLSLPLPSLVLFFFYSLTLQFSSSIVL